MTFHSINASQCRRKMLASFSITTQQTTIPLFGYIIEKIKDIESIGGVITSIYLSTLSYLISVVKGWFQLKGKLSLT